MRDMRELARPSEGISQLAKDFIAEDPATESPQRRARERGFTLTELMIVVSVIAVVATIAFIGLRNNQFDGAYLRFTDEITLRFSTATSCVIIPMKENTNIASGEAFI